MNLGGNNNVVFPDDCKRGSNDEREAVKSEASSGKRSWKASENEVSTRNSKVSQYNLLWKRINCQVIFCFI